jgi:ATP adenylyltransferase
MAYIRAPKSTACIFCEYAAAGPAHHRENLVLCERPGAYVMLNRYPFAAGHLLVVPRRHVADLLDLPADEYVALMTLVRDACGALRDATGAEGLNVGLNLGATAGAGIAAHLHVHIVPRWKGDLNFMPVIGDVTVIPEALDATRERLLPHFAPLGQLGDDGKEIRP